MLASPLYKEKIKEYQEFERIFNKLNTDEDKIMLVRGAENLRFSFVLDNDSIDLRVDEIEELVEYLYEKNDDFNLSFRNYGNDFIMSLMKVLKLKSEYC